LALAGEGIEAYLCDSSDASLEGSSQMELHKSMKKIEAIIRSSKFEAAKEALGEIGIDFFTFSEVKGYGRQKGDHVVYRGAAYDVGYIARLKLEIVLTQDKLASAIETIRKAAHTGEIGDGKILCYDLNQFISIRTGLVNESAL